MRYGLINNEKVEATETGQRAICPCCKTELLSRCGEFKVNHWAHVNLIECDTWHTNKTEWHIDWQNEFPKECQEVIYTNEETGEKHIADVSYENFIFEFQHSGIKFEEIANRTNFYKSIGKKVVWIFDYTKKGDNFSFYHWKLSNVSRIKEWKYKPKHIPIMQDWDTLTLIDVDYELRLLLFDSLSIKIDNIKEIVTPEFRTKLFNLQKYFHQDIEKRRERATIEYNKFLNRSNYEGDQEIFNLEKRLEEITNERNILDMQYDELNDKYNVLDYEHKELSRMWDESQMRNKILQDEMESLKKKLSASTNLFSYN